MKMNTRAFLSLTFAIFFAGAHAATITFTNNCPYTVWPGSLTTSNDQPQLPNIGFELKQGTTNQVITPVPWTGLFWARTGCTTAADGLFSCETADCRSGQVTCNGNAAAPPLTKVEINIDADGGADIYYVRIDDGFNVPMSVGPQGGTGDCQPSSCPANVNSVCPEDLQVKGGDGSVIACKSACTKFNEPQYCCTPPYETPEKCRPTKYSLFFKEQCPQAFTYGNDDKSSLFVCFGGPNYAITFCPS